MVEADFFSVKTPFISPICQSVQQLVTKVWIRGDILLTEGKKEHCIRGVYEPEAVGLGPGGDSP
jgi:hypothetical protein